MILLLTISLVLWITGPTCGAPVEWEMVDMTYTFDENTLGWPTAKKFDLQVTMNGTTEEGYWLQLDEYSGASHVGTHIDAPCHLAKGKWCVDEIPLERLMGKAAVVDITEKAESNPDAMVDVEDLKHWEELSGTSLDGSIVVIRSGWGRKWKDRDAFIGTTDNDVTKMHFPGMSPEAAQWLVDNRHIHGVISETLSLDQGQSRDFMAHRILLETNVYGLENVANVEEIPIFGAMLFVRPMKVAKAGGAPTTITAEFPKGQKKVNP